MQQRLLLAEGQGALARFIQGDGCKLLRCLIVTDQPAIIVDAIRPMVGPIGLKVFTTDWTAFVNSSVLAPIYSDGSWGTAVAKR
jgi:hypothetical protein